jgi:hypothetical protein
MLCPSAPAARGVVFCRVVSDHMSLAKWDLPVLPGHHPVLAENAHPFDSCDR